MMSGSLRQGRRSGCSLQDEEGLHDEAQRMTQSFAKAMELLDQIDEIMGDSPMDLAEFTDIYAQDCLTLRWESFRLQSTVFRWAP